MLNLKKRHMSFETDTLRVVTPLDPYEGDMYNEPVDEDAWSSIIENIYKITSHREDYNNPTADGELSWRSIKSYDADFEDTIHRRQNNLYEVSARRCVRIKKVVCWIGFELCDVSQFYRTRKVETFLIQMEKSFPMEQD
jgi:hypothetical protein